MQQERGFFGRMTNRTTRDTTGQGTWRVRKARTVFRAIAGGLKIEGIEQGALRRF